jgi:hypothetical protein
VIFHQDKKLTQSRKVLNALYSSTRKDRKDKNFQFFFAAWGFTTLRSKNHFL